MFPQEIMDATNNKHKRIDMNLEMFFINPPYTNENLTIFILYNTSFRLSRILRVDSAFCQCAQKPPLLFVQVHNEIGFHSPARIFRLCKSRKKRSAVRGFRALRCATKSAAFGNCKLSQSLIKTLILASEPWSKNLSEHKFCVRPFFKTM